MEAAEKTLSYRDDTGLYRKLVHGNKDKCSAETRNDESNYVDLDELLDWKSNGRKVIETCNGNQRTVLDPNHNLSDEQSPGLRELSDNIDQMLEHSKDNGPDALVIEDSPMDLLLTLPDSNVDLGNSTELQTKVGQLYCDVPSEFEELQYTDMYLNSKTESDDSESIVLRDHRVPNIIEDESHYITTHEIQLTELDHDLDYDSGRDIEDDNLVYSFVDYASFESNETTEGTLTLEGRNQAQCKNDRQRVACCVVASTESELCDSDKCASSDESLCRDQNGGGNSEGQIHLSIKATSREIIESNKILEKEKISYHTNNLGSRSQLFYTSTGAKAEALHDRSQYFIPAPGRQHLATKLRGKDFNEYSSGASSSISELDDADKEVRNLTARSFRSLACPYFDAINLSTSSESSMSEYGLGLNKWAAFVDLTYGNMSQSREPNRNTHKSATATDTMSKNADFKRINRMAVGNKKESHTETSSLNKKISSPQHASPFTPNADATCQFQPSGEVITLTKTLNFHCKVESGSPECGKRIICSDDAPRSCSMDDLTAARPAKAGNEVSLQHIDLGEITEATQKKASFASSLLTNVISKKMQLEQECKKEKEGIRHSRPQHSACRYHKDTDIIKGIGRGVYMQYSDMGLGYNIHCAGEKRAVDSRPVSCDLKEVCADASINEADVTKDGCEATMGLLSHSENSAFKSWNDSEPGPHQEHDVSTLCDGTFRTTDHMMERELDTGALGGKLTKLSRLFVPSSLLLPKEKVLKAPVPGNSSELTAEKELELTGNIHVKSDTGVTAGDVKGSKAPEIKIHLRSIKENKDNPLNIANLLTPNISYPVKTAADRIPHFNVRDIRDKCKFQTPIHQVRDVRKLVKSSYRLVSLENSERDGTVAAAELQKDQTASKHISHEDYPSSSIVIKCESVNTKSSDKPCGLLTETPKRTECARNEHTMRHRATGRPPLGFTKHLNADMSGAKHEPEKMVEERKIGSKIPNQAALDKLKAAVKTMEQLYVFDRNEWKRKSQATQPLTDSHVQSLIASKKHGSRERLSTETNTNRLPETCNFRENKASMRMTHVPVTEETFKAQSQGSQRFSNKTVFHLGNSINTDITSSCSGVIDVPQTTGVVKSVSSSSMAAPLAFDRGRYKSCATKESLPQLIKSGNPDSENYLTMPAENELQNSNLKVTGSSREVSQTSITDPKRPDQHCMQCLKETPKVMEKKSLDTASIYHSFRPYAVQGAKQPQVLCLSPNANPVPATPSGGDTFQLTQRKMLLDPPTGHYYLVDTPVQPATRRLIDLESGQYVDIPQGLPVNTVPVSPTTLNAGGAYKPTYMIYPGFLSPTLGAQVVMAPQVAPQVAPHSEAENVAMETAPGKCILGPVVGQAGNIAESPYYSATRGSEPVSAPSYHFTSRGGVAVSEEKPPVVSITSQQRPRIITPHSYDVTTMSLVVDHR